MVFADGVLVAVLDKFMVDGVLEENSKAEVLPAVEVDVVRPDRLGSLSYLTT